MSFVPFDFYKVFGIKKTASMPKNFKSSLTSWKPFFLSIA